VGGLADKAARPATRALVRRLPVARAEDALMPPSQGDEGAGNARAEAALILPSQGDESAGNA